MKRVHTYVRLLVFFLVLTFISIHTLNAQSLYPVTASLRMSGPSSSRFFTFSQPGMIAGRPNRIALDLRLNDLDEPSLDVRLKWDISGSDIAFSSSVISATNIVSLVSGQFVRLDNAALSSYFQPSAFDGLSDDFLLRSDGLLPEGMYEICVTAYELTQGKQVSNTSCQIIFLEELEPPLIVTPVDEVLPTYPQNVILNWQANHLAVFPVQYTIALWEEIEGLSPDQITFQTPPLYTETVLNRTAFVFNASHPLLTPGRNYLVQVRARDNDDAYVFKNNGFSPIHRFHYGAQEDEGICEAPGAGEFGFGYGNLLVLAWNGGDLASALASADAKAEGAGSSAASGLTTRASTTSVLSLSDDFGETTKKAGGFYRIRYRILGTDEWSSVDTDQLTAGIKGLWAGKTYEIEISKVCASGIVPSPIFQVTVPKLPRRLPQECGSEPSTEGFEETPIDELFVNDTIIAAGAYVRITNVVGGPAGWTGEGEVAMPFLPKSRVAVEFSNIVVNVNYELIAGYIETVYDDKMSNVVNLDAISGLFDNGPSIEQVNYAIPIDTIMQGPGGIIIVVRSDGGIDSFKAPIIVIAPGLEAVLVNGYQFEVFDMDDMVDSIAPEQFTFMAHPEQKYGFDGVKKELLTEYKEEAGFVMPYKSVAFGEADKIKAVLTGDPPNDADVHFVELSTAADLKFTRSGNEYDIITGGLKSGLSQVIALGPNGIMGMFQVMGTAKEFVTVHLVPLNGYGKNTDAQSIEKAATDILRQAGFSVRVDVLDVGLQYDGAKISLENHFASAYSPDMKQIISQLGRKVNKEAHDVYMILTDKMEGNTTGFMPKGMGIGFMELGGGGQTLAHELCHGLFNMPHIFEGFYEGKTKGSLPDNLMDYNEGTALYYRQWARMQSPGVHLAWFDDEREGKYDRISGAENIKAMYEKFGDKKYGTLSFYKYSGELITFKVDKLESVTFTSGENYSLVESFDLAPLGAISDAYYDGNLIFADYSTLKKDYTDTLTSSVKPKFGLVSYNCYDGDQVKSNVFQLEAPVSKPLAFDGLISDYLNSRISEYSTNSLTLDGNLLISDNAESQNYLSKRKAFAGCGSALAPYIMVVATILSQHPEMYFQCLDEGNSILPIYTSDKENFSSDFLLPSVEDNASVRDAIGPYEPGRFSTIQSDLASIKILIGDVYRGLDEIISDRANLEEYSSYNELNKYLKSQLADDCIWQRISLKSRKYALQMYFENSAFVPGTSENLVLLKLLQSTPLGDDRSQILDFLALYGVMFKLIDSSLEFEIESEYVKTISAWIQEIYNTSTSKYYQGEAFIHHGSTLHAFLQMVNSNDFVAWLTNKRR